MIDTEHHYLVMQIRDLLEKKLDLTIKDHGCWRIQALIHDELEERKEIRERKVKKLLTNTNK